MFLPTPRLKQAKQTALTAVSYIHSYRRSLLIIFLLAPFTAYLIAWTLCTTETFFPRPLRDAKAVLIVVAHPDDECPRL